MIKLLTILLILLPVCALSTDNTAHPVTILRVTDGDTVVIAAPWLPDPLKKEIAVRIYGVDTPEKTYRAQCDAEALRGEQATEFTKNVVAESKRQEVIYREWDKYGGRVLGEIVLDGQSLRSMLLTNDLAYEYHGEKKKSWCGVK